MEWKAFTLVDTVRKKMMDEESVKLYDARLDYLVYRNYHAYAKAALQDERLWMIPQLDEYSKYNELKRIVVWGCGLEGIYIVDLLKRSTYKQIPVVFCDSNRQLWQTKKEDITVISPSELMSGEYIDSVVIISPKWYFGEIYTQLSNMLFPQSRILIPEGIYGHHLYGVRDWQYFDFWEEAGIRMPDGKGEVFLDVGCLNGKTSVDFCKWCQDGYDAIYAFEANPNMAETCRRVFEKNKLKNTKLIVKAAWDKQEQLNFQIDEGAYPGGSRVTEGEANTNVFGDTIDNCLCDSKVTFIKMDIEGSEYKALIGAENVISKWKPRLAISLYHKPEDVLEIPYAILKVNPEYRFAIRQYASNMHETVLYAF